MTEWIYTGYATESLFYQADSGVENKIHRK